MNELEIHQAVSDAIKMALGVDEELHVAMYELDASEGGNVPIGKDVHSRLKSVKGICLDSNNPTLMGKRGTFSLQINNQSYFSADNKPPARALMTNHSQGPNGRYFYFKEVSESTIKLDFDYIDTDTTDTTFSAYKVYIYLIGKKR